MGSTIPGSLGPESGPFCPAEWELCVYAPSRAQNPPHAAVQKLERKATWIKIQEDENIKNGRLFSTPPPRISLAVGALPVLLLTLVSSFHSFRKPSPCPQRTQALLNGIALLPETHWLGLPDAGGHLEDEAGVMETDGDRRRFDYLLLPKADPPGNDVRGLLMGFLLVTA